MSDEEIGDGEVHFTDKRGQNKAPTLGSIIDEMSPEAKATRRAELEAKLASGDAGADETAELMVLQSEDIPDPAAQPRRVMTAFLVLIDFDNSASASGDVEQLLELERGATYDDITAGCAVVARDIEAMNITTRILSAMENRATAMGLRGR